jgi:hypothetical protein
MLSFARMAGTTWTERLGSARRAQLVGRDAELARLSAFARDERARLAYVHGPAGSGKTLLLREWLRTAAETGARVAVVDAQVDVSRPEEIEAIAAGATLVAIDDFHRLAPLEAWFYDVFLPARGDDVRVIVTSRRAPRREELLDPAWRELMMVIELGELSPADCRTYLETRGVAASEHARITSFAHGIPLWLCIAADLALAHPDRPFDPSRTREQLAPVITELLDDAPSHLHRRALHAASLLSVVTESLLARALEVDAAQAAIAFRWLSDRPYVQRSGEGIRVHDALREALRADLVWRDPDAARTMLDGVYAALLASIWSASGPEQERRVVHLMATLAHEPGGKALGGAGNEEYYSDTVSDDELPEVLGAVRRHEGDAAAHVAELWLKHQRDGLVGLRDADRRLAAFLVYVNVDESVPTELREADPFVPTILSYLAKNAPLRAGETAVMARWWVSIESYQRPEPMQLRLFAHIGWKLAFVGGAVIGAVHADPEEWIRRPERPHEVFGTFELGAAPYGIFGTDWRRSSRERWVERLVSTFRAMPVGPPGPAIEYEVLGRERFGRAVRAALRACARRDRLAESALLATRLVAERAAPNSAPAARTEALVALLASAVSTLAAQPGTKRHALTLERTFWQSDTKGLVVADDLGLPYGSYRRILNEGVELLVEELWKMEIAQRQGAGPTRA